MSNDNPAEAEFTETEIKFYSPDLGAVKAKLVHHGAILVGKRTHELNLRFDHPSLDLISKRVVLRLRRDQKSTLTYKDNARLTNGIISRFELETYVESFDNTKNILLRLGFQETDSYEKFRATYSFQKVEIVLDELPYGNFVEIEGAHQNILETIKILNLSPASQIRQSYLQIFYLCQNWAENALNVKIKKCSFVDFAGVRIPREVITQGENEYPLE